MSVISSVRGTVSWPGEDDYVAGELQVRHQREEEVYFIFAFKTAGGVKRVCWSLLSHWCSPFRSACSGDKNWYRETNRYINNYRSTDIDVIDQSIKDDTLTLRSSNFVGQLVQSRAGSTHLSLWHCTKGTIIWLSGKYANEVMWSESKFCLCLILWDLSIFIPGVVNQ